MEKKKRKITLKYDETNIMVEDSLTKSISGSKIKKIHKSYFWIKKKFFLFIKI